jgi:hypothetical protein
MDRERRPEVDAAGRRPAPRPTRYFAFVLPCILLLGVCCPVASFAQEGYLGAEACGACHHEEFDSQSRSEHARSLSRATEHALASRFAGLEAELGKPFRYSLQRREQSLLFGVQQDETIRLQAVDWAFGAGQQAVTFVSRLDERTYVELRASYYSSAGLGLTPGHQNHHPESADDALGLRYKIFSPRSEILSCFGCHSTGLPSLGQSFEIEPAELGVRCESCHGPGRQHAEMVSQGELSAARRLIGNPARLDSRALMKFCGECHRPPASQDAAIDWSNPWNVRHQPVYLTQSSCFQKSAGGLSCMACHDPHEPLRRNDASYYSERCARCHSEARNPPAEVCRAEPGCVFCHMPAVRPQPELAFHNHWIGIYTAENPLRPQR